MDHESDPRPGQFAIMWDQLGLEAVQRLPDPADTTFALLKGEEPPPPPNLLHWELRARYNNQRHYEIWIISAQPGIELKDIIEMFENDPQSAADTIRRIGHCWFSDRQKTDQIVIR